MSLAIGAIASFLGAWLAANLALRRFYKEKIWERKAAAYTTIFEALHQIRNWYEKHLEAYIEQLEIGDEKTKTLQEFANKAKDELEATLAKEVWIIPDLCRNRLDQLTSQLKHRDQDWFTYLDEGSNALNVATQDLRTLVQNDMREIDLVSYVVGRMKRFTS